MTPTYKFSGQMRGNHPIGPHTATLIAASATASINTRDCTRRTEMPSADALFSPSAITSRSRQNYRLSGNNITSQGTITRTNDQPLPHKLSVNQTLFHTVHQRIKRVIQANSRCSLRMKIEVNWLRLWLRSGGK